MFIRMINRFQVTKCRSGDNGWRWHKAKYKFKLRSKWKLLLRPGIVKNQNLWKILPKTSTHGDCGHLTKYTSRFKTFLSPDHYLRFHKNYINSFTIDWYVLMNISVAGSCRCNLLDTLSQLQLHCALSTKSYPEVVINSFRGYETNYYVCSVTIVTVRMIILIIIHSTQSSVLIRTVIFIQGAKLISFW